MVLTRGSGRPIRDPKENEVIDGICDLQADGDFIILERSVNEYIQFNGELLEYRDGDQLFRLRQEPAQFELAIENFLLYLNGGASAIQHLSWQDVTQEVLGKRAKSWLLPTIVALLVTTMIGVGAWIYLRRNDNWNVLRVP